MLLHLNTCAVHILVHTEPCMAPRLLGRNVCASSSKPGKDGIPPIPLLVPLGPNPGSKGMDQTFSLTLSELRLTQKFQLGKMWSINLVLKGYRIYLHHSMLFVTESCTYQKRGCSQQEQWKKNRSGSAQILKASHWAITQRVRKEQPHAFLTYSDVISRNMTIWHLILFHTGQNQHLLKLPVDLRYLQYWITFSLHISSHQTTIHTD